MSQALLQSQLDTSTYRRIEDYAKVTGVPVQNAVNEAVNDWMDTTGDFIQEELLARRGKGARSTVPKGAKKPSASVKNSSTQATQSATISIEESPSWSRQRVLREAVV